MSSSPRATYRFWRDPLCLLSWAAYGFNRFWLISHFGGGLPFLSEHFDDALLIPAVLPLLFYARWRLGLTSSPAPPGWSGVLLWCAGWSFLFEWIGPHFLHRSVGDWGDVTAYFVGGVLSALWWNRTAQSRRAAPAPLS